MNNIFIKMFSYSRTDKKNFLSYKKHRKQSSITTKIHNTTQQHINVLKELAPTNHTKKVSFYTLSQISNDTDLEGLTIISRNSQKREDFSPALLDPETTIYIYVNLYFFLSFVLYFSHSEKYILCLLYLSLFTYLMSPPSKGNVLAKNRNKHNFLMDIILT